MYTVSLALLTCSYLLRICMYNPLSLHLMPCSRRLPAAVPSLALHTRASSSYLERSSTTVPTEPSGTSAAPDAAASISLSSSPLKPGASGSLEASPSKLSGVQQGYSIGMVG